MEKFLCKEFHSTDYLFSGSLTLRNISCRIANADTQCGRITNPPERVI